MSSLRARHAPARVLARAPHGEVSLDSDSEQERLLRRRRAIKRQTRHGIRNYTLFLSIFLGIPLLLVFWLTPFFVFERLRCRAGHKLWPDSTVRALESGYAEFFSDPPLYLSDSYNQSVHWGSYEPTRIFALRNRAALPTMFALAWYDTAGRHPVRHLMYGMHNKVNRRRATYKRGNDPDVVQIRWVVHDGVHYGKESIVDRANGLSMEVEFLKSPSGESWHARVHAILESPASPVELVLYAIHADGSEELVLQKPVESSTSHTKKKKNTNGYSGRSFDDPVVRGWFYNHRNERDGFTWRVHEEGEDSRAGGWLGWLLWRWGRKSQPWRVYGLHVDMGKDGAPKAGPQQRGTTAADRMIAKGKGVFAAFGATSAEVSEMQLDLRELTSSTFTYLETDKPIGADAVGTPLRRNMIVLKKTYDTSFRLELSFHPDHPLHESGGTDGAAATRHSHAHRGDRAEDVVLSTCQLTNLFRGRDKMILRHANKVVRSWVNIFNLSTKYLQNVAVHVIGEAFGSMQYSDGYFLVANRTQDALWDVRGRQEAALQRSATHTAKSATHNDKDDRMNTEEVGGDERLAHIRARALGAIGSRTDEPFGQQSLTGTQLLFLVRWNKETMKDILASWLLGSQDPTSGFVPRRNTFTEDTRHFAPLHWRHEHTRFAGPPTLLLGLQELLREMRRKEERVRQRRLARSSKRRNQPDYYAREAAADMEYLAMLLPALRRWRQWWHETQCGGVTPALSQACLSSFDENTDLTRHSNTDNAQTRDKQEQFLQRGYRRRPLEQWPREPTGLPEDLLVYRWHGRDGERLPFSEMEDYPRALCEGEHHMEAHVDLFCWIALLSQLISQIEEEFLGGRPSVTVDWEMYLNAAHWNEAEQRYADRLGCVPVGSRVAPADVGHDEPSTSPSSPAPAPTEYSPYTGYVNLYPLVTGTVRKNHTRVIATLRIAQQQLMSQHGLMSVSFDSVRQAREDGLSHDSLWMGYIRPSFNLMFLYSLKSNCMTSHSTADAAVTKLARQVYEQTRARIAKTMLNDGRWWEFYNPVNGRGEGSKTYIGAHALILGILDSFS